MSIRYTADQLQRKFQGPAGGSGYPRLADAMRSEGRFDEAIALCREGLGARPSVSGYVVLGKALIDAGNPDEARAQFEAALRLDPRCLSAMHALAGLMDKLQWADAAAGYYRSILEVEPWDAEIRALLHDAAPAGAPPAGGPATETASAFAPPAPGPDQAAEDDPFPKPEGFQGDVMEVNLNDMADEFLPSSGGEAPEASLEDALGAAAAAGDFSPAPDPAASPKPMDILPSASGPEPLGENAPAPISGRDVEERLDSLFGNEDAGGPSATATWTAAPDLPDEPSPPASATAFSAVDAAATATGEMRATVADPLAPEPEGILAAGDEAVPAGESPVQGEDIERRLDEIFSLSGEDDKPPAPAALSASDLPVAPGPKIEEAVIMGETVAFGDRPAPAIEDASAPAEGELVTGQDVADKLDSLFGPDSQAQAATGGPAAPESKPETAEFPAGPAAFPVPPAETAPPGPAGDALLPTESMEPADWTADAPQVTGSDVEAQLDRLFNLESAPAGGAQAAPPGPAAAPAAQGNIEDTVTPKAPAAEPPPWPEAAADGAGDTLILPSADLLPDPEPALPEPDAAEAFGTLALEDSPSLSDTTSIEMVDGGDVADRLDRLFADSPAAPSADPAAPAGAFPVPEPFGDLESGATMEVPIPVQDDAPQAAGADRPDAGLAAQAPELAPMTDEEEGYPEEEEMPDQGAGANVATVTLAEIYFQQGLREQALQIYRQLLEREPGNESVRKRIAEIEASKPEGERGPDSDPRRPRPGLKVPKRKK